MWARPALAAVLLLGAFACFANKAGAEFVALPTIEDGVARLRLAHAINPRLPKLDNQELQVLLRVMKKTVQEHFDIRVELTKPVEIGVHALMSKIPDQALNGRKGEIFDFKKGTGDRGRLLRGYVKTLKGWGAPLDNLIAYAKPWLYKPVLKRTFQGLAEALVSTHLFRLESWRKRLAADGQPMLDNSFANEWIVWDLLGYSELPFDVIVTNQPVISAEYDDSGLNSALRGGVSAGSTSYSRSGYYGTYSFISTFPFSEFATLPAGTSDITSRDQAVRLAGQYMAHEIGHMLLLLGHPFGNPACVMRPEPLFHFAKWSKKLDAIKCRVGSNRAMKPGAAKIYFRPDW